MGARPALGLFDQRDDAVAGVLFIVGAAIVWHRLPFGLDLRQPLSFEAMARFWLLTPLFAVAGAAMYRFHLVWLRSEDRPALRMALGMPRAFAVFFAYGFGVLLGMLLILPLGLLELIWRKVRRRPAEEPAPVWLRMTMVPLFLLIGPIAPYGSGNGPMYEEMRDKPRYFGGATLLMGPIILAAATLALHGFTRDNPGLDPTLLNVLFTIWLGDFLTAALAMTRVHFVRRGGQLLTDAELQGGMLAALLVGLIFWAEQVRGFERAALLGWSWVAAAVLGGVGVLLVRAHHHWLHDEAPADRWGHATKVIRLVLGLPLYGALFLATLVVMPAVSLVRSWRARRTRAKLRGDVPRDAPPPLDPGFILGVPLWLLFSPTLHLQQAKRPSPIVDTAQERRLVQLAVRGLILLVGGVAVAVLLGRRGEIVEVVDSVALSLWLGLWLTDLWLLRGAVDELRAPDEAVRALAG